MFIGACLLTYRLPGNDSLKAKRQVSHSVINKLRQKFNVAAAEVGGIDTHQTLVIGFSCVSNNAGHAEEMMDAAIQYADSMHVDAELVEVERDVLDGV
ncbi:MAG: DUF503 domain-containing protein [Dehalococcoidia bacterium]